MAKDLSLARDITRVAELEAARALVQREQIRSLRCVVVALIRQLAALGHVAKVSRAELDADPPVYVETYDPETESALLAIKEEWT